MNASPTAPVTSVRGAISKVTRRPVTVRATKFMAVTSDTMCSIASLTERFVSANTRGGNARRDRRRTFFSSWSDEPLENLWTSFRSLLLWYGNNKRKAEWNVSAWWHREQISEQISQRDRNENDCLRLRGKHIVRSSSERKLDISESFTAYIHIVLFLFPHSSLHSTNRRGSFLGRQEVANYPMDVTILRHQSSSSNRRSRKRSWMEKHAEETRGTINYLSCTFLSTWLFAARHDQLIVIAKLSTVKISRTANEWKIILQARLHGKTE